MGGKTSGKWKLRKTDIMAHPVLASTAISEERLAEAFDRIDADDSGYISAENLKALLGNDFPKEEIDAIIKEADLTKDGKISYSEFLALWEDKNETKHAENVAAIRALADTYDSEHSSVISDQVSEEDGAEVAARVNFLEEKRLSERKATGGDAAGGRSKHEETEGSKHVGFRDDVSTIPSVICDEENEPSKKEVTEPKMVKQASL